MRFNIAVIEPENAKYAHFLYDPTRYMAFGLESLGHDCSITRNNLDPMRLNLLIGGHQLFDPKSVQAIVSSGVRYVLIQSEVIRGGQVNSVCGTAHFESCYLPLLRGAVRVWEWSPAQIVELGRLGIEADRIVIGFHPHMEEIHHKRNKDIGVLWFGSVTEHRRRIFAAMTERKVPLVAVFDAVPFYRNDLIARARIVLTLQQDPASHINPARILYAANNRSLVAGESPAEGQHHWIENCYLGAPAEGVPELCRDLLARDDLQRLADERFEKLKAWPMTRFLEPLVERLATWKILVTGATGFIGHHLVARLSERGHVVVALVRDIDLARGKLPAGVALSRFDLLSDAPLDFAVTDGAELVVHLAWPGPPNYREAFHVARNQPASARFLGQLVERGVPRVLVTGTCLEYGLQSGALSSDRPAKPRIPYAIGKDELRRSLERLRVEKPFALQWARLFYTFGEGQSPRSLLSLLDAAIDRGDPEFPMSGGEQRRDYLPVAEVAEKLCRLCEDASLVGISNVCSGQPIAVKELVHRHIEERGARIRPVLGALPYPDYEPMSFWGTPNI